MTKTRKRKKSRWYMIGVIISLLQLVLSIIAGIVLKKSDILPSQYYLGILLLLALFWIFCFLMIVAGQKYLPRKFDEKKKKRLIRRRSIGTVISAIIILICVVVVSMLGQMLSTLKTITNGSKVTVESINVYVMADDPAETIADAAGYSFGYTESYDYENTDEAILAINEELDKEIETVNFETAMDVVGGLYDGTVKAIIMNEAYADIVADQEEFADFRSRTKVIYSFEIKTENEAAADIDITTEPFVMYISGSDTRSALLSKSNSDVNILALVNPNTHQVLLLNTPRDYYVHTTVSGDSRDKLTHCGVYGIDCSMGTLGNLYNVKVDYYMQINFNGFKTLVDALGGISVYSDATFTSDADFTGADRSYQYYEGMNDMDGGMALAFCRERHHLPDGDNGRGRHQMAVISAIIDKISSPKIITGYSDIMKSLEGMFITNIESDNISDLVKMQIDEGIKWEIKSFAVKGSDGNETCYSMPKTPNYVMWPNEEYVEQAKNAVSKIMHGEIVTDEDLGK